MNKNILLFAAAILLAGAAVLYFVFPETFSKVDSKGEKPDISINGDNTPGYTITPVPIDDSIVLPDLTRSVQFSESVPEEVRAIINAKVQTLASLLEEDPTNAGAWYDLAIYYHNANDFEGAREVWEFLINVAPKDTVAYDNLGKLYHFSTPDFVKSESYFNQSLAVDPMNLNAYLGLVELYRYSYKTETTAAADTLNKAIAKFPERLDLVLTLGAYYAEVGNYIKAREVLEEGLNMARDNADLDMVSAFGKEIERLPQ